MSNDITVKVTLDSQENFIVENLETNEKRTLTNNQFWGSKFKYASGFEAIFLATFDAKSKVLLDKKAEEKMQRMINFNRIDT